MKKRSWFMGGTVLVAGFLFLLCLAPGVGESTAELDALLKKERGRLLARVQVGELPVKDDAAPPPTPPDQVVLSEDVQKRIWDLEHYTFELEWKFGKLVKDAIQAGDRARFLSLFLPDSACSIPSWDDEQTAQGSWWRQYEIGGDIEARAHQASAEEVADFFAEVMADFTEIKKIGLRILQIEPDAQQQNEYRLKILLTASGTDRLGPASLSSVHRLIVQFADDQEIIDGRILKHWTVESIVNRGSNEAFFAEATEVYGLDQLHLPDNWKCPPGTQPDSYTCQFAVDDFDQDGYLDLAVSSLQGDQYLLRSVEGKSFENVTEKVGLPSSRFFSLTTFATWIDYDNDGFPDLLFGKNLYHNDQGRKFRRVTTSSGLKFDSATMGAVVVDYDCDGKLDLYVLNHLGDRGGQRIGFVDDDTISGVKNRLWRNLGKGLFVDVTAEAGIDGAARHSFAASWFHANDDRFPDLYLVNDFGRNCFYINRGDGKFDDITDSAGVGDFANSMGVAAGDLDNDGRSEIYVANMFSKMGRRIIAHVSASDYPEGVFRGIEGACAGSHLYRRSGEELVFDEISVEKSVNEIGWAYAPVFADFDADGLLDIYATSGFLSVDRHKPDG